MSVDRSQWPFMVRVGLSGVHSRGAAWVFLWLTIVIAAACVAYGFVNTPFFAGGALLLAAVWYYLSIRWVDEHSRWS